MAIRLAKAFGSTTETWIRLQAAYDVAQAQAREDQIEVELTNRNQSDSPAQDHFIVLRPSLHRSRQERPPSLESSRKDVYHGVAPFNCSVASMRLIRHGMPSGQRLLLFHGC